MQLPVSASGLGTRSLSLYLGLGKLPKCLCCKNEKQGTTDRLEATSRRSQWQKLSPLGSAVFTRLFQASVQPSFVDMAHLWACRWVSLPHSSPFITGRGFKSGWDHGGRSGCQGQRQGRTGSSSQACVCTRVHVCAWAPGRGGVVGSLPTRCTLPTHSRTCCSHTEV